MHTEEDFYVCLTCFEIVDDIHDHWDHKVIRYPGFPAGDNQLKPPADGHGNLKARTPRWLQAGLWPAASSFAAA